MIVNLTEKDIVLLSETIINANKLHLLHFYSIRSKKNKVKNADGEMLYARDVVKLISKDINGDVCYKDLNKVQYQIYSDLRMRSV